MKKSTIFIGLISLIIAFGSEKYFGLSPYVEDTTLLNVLWAIVNIMFLTTTIAMLKEYNQILSLKGLTMRKTRLYLNIFVYVAFIIFLNSFFLGQLYLRDNLLINKLSNPLIMILVLFTFTMNLYSGIFPTVEEKDNIKIFTIKEKGPFRNGREKYDVQTGTYENGLVFGIYNFPYEGIKNIYEEKSGTLIIKGKDQRGSYRINVEAPKTRFVVKKLLEEEREKNKLEGIKISL